MKASPRFIKDVFQLVAAALHSAGWTKRKSNIFSLDLSEEAYGCVGLNKALYRGGILQINPVVSVGNKRVENLVADLMRMRFEPYTTACLGMNVGYLMAEQKYAPWSFQEDTNCEAVVADLVATVEKYGRPFMEHNVTLAALYNALLNSKRGTPPDQLDYRIAAAADLLGKRTEAEAFVDARLREIGNRNDEAAEWFRKFAANLLER